MSRRFLNRLAIGLTGLMLIASPVAAQSNSGTDTWNALDRANGAIQAERLEEALHILKGIDSPDHAVIARTDYLLGELFMKVGKPARAYDLFESASLNQMDDAEATLGMARAALELGKLTQAASHAKFALKADPDLAGAQLVLAKIEERTGRIDAARTRFDKLMTNQPDSEAVTVAFARFLFDRGEEQFAVSLLDRYTKRYDRAAEAYDLLGRYLWVRGEQEAALAARAEAAKQFTAQGNDYRAEGIYNWLLANDGSGQYVPQVAERTPRPAPQPAPQPAPVAPEPKPEPTPAPTPEPQPVPKVEPAPAPEPTPAPEPAPVAVPKRPVTPAVPVLSRPEPWPFAPNTKIRSGSGVILDGGRLVVTNRHVAEGIKNIAVRTGTGHLRRATVMSMSSIDDLAVLKLDRPFPAAAALPTDVLVDAKPGRAAIVMGYPLSHLLGDESPSLTNGIVSKTAGFQDDPTMLQITAKMNKGNSGGPVFDDRGNLIGIAVAKLDVVKVYEETGHMVEDVNLAIKTLRVRKLLGIGAPPDGGATEPLSYEDLYQKMLPSVVMIVGSVDE